MDEMKESPDSPNNSNSDKPANSSMATCPFGVPPQKNVAEAENLDPKQIPEEAKGLCWGGFLLTWIWGIGNRTWIALIALAAVFIPKVGNLIALVMAFVLLFKGREWAWKNKEWTSIAHFNHVQRNWTIAGLIVVLTVLFLMIIAITVGGWDARDFR
jgi:hypothetical protein